MKQLDLEPLNRINKTIEALKRAEQEERRIRRDFWINILTGGALLFLAMVCLEIVT